MTSAKNQQVQRIILLLTIGVTLCVILMGKTAPAAEQIDQSNLPEWAGGWTHVNPTGEGQATMWQTLRPTCTNVIAVAIDILTNNPGQGDDVLTVEIAQDGNILTSAESSVADGFDGLLRFEFPKAVPLVPEQIYELKVRDTGKTQFGWKYGPNTYERGSRYVFAEERPGTDWLFRTYSNVEPTPTKYSGGTGKPNDPYQIATAEDLMFLGDSPEDYDKHFILTAGIDLDPNLPGRKVFDKAVIAPASPTTEDPYFEGTPFTGVFNGNGHKILHLTITGMDYLGLFGRVQPGGKVEDLGVVDINIVGSGLFVGGLVGISDGTVTYAYSTGAVTGNERVGGLVGVNGGIVDNCYSTCIVRGDGDFDGYVGGLVGCNWRGAIITTSYSTGIITGSNGVGGLAGGNGGCITRSYSEAEVSGYMNLGGLVGINFIGFWAQDDYGSIAMSFSTGAVSGTSAVGGLVGHMKGEDCVVAMSYSTGLVTGNESVGGLVGHSWINARITSSFWDIETSGQTASAGGMGLTTVEMQEIERFLIEGWDFVDEISNGTNDYWQISPGHYPRLCYLTGESPVMPEGLGTEEQPYLIRDARDLGTIWFEPMAHYRLETSIDLSGITWPMAVIPWLNGTFDGNGNKISNLDIQGKGTGYLGLFGQLGSGAEIFNLGLEGIDVNGTGDYIGGLVGSNGDWLSLDPGGVLTDCYTEGAVSGKEIVGGLVGYNNGRIAKSYSISTVRGRSGLFDGGVGGLVGRNDDSITTSYSTGIVTGNDENVGGLVGYNNGSITRSYSTSTVSGDIYVGGLVGCNSSDIATSYSAGRVNGKSGVGGLVGRSITAIVTTSFWDMDASGRSKSAGGFGKTTPEMQTSTTFLEAGWDFVDETTNGTEDIWWILEGQDYPRLWWEIGDETSP